MQTFPIFHLTSLDSEHCWSLLAEHAFGANNSSERSKLEELGREIVKKCDGLPLAAVVLGGLLRTKLSKNDWSKVFESNIWDLPNLNVQPALLLSYHFLPALEHLFQAVNVDSRGSYNKLCAITSAFHGQFLWHGAMLFSFIDKTHDQYELEVSFVTRGTSSQWLRSMPHFKGD
ncbi:hypothetical protein Ahy_A10g046914 [Arachis hypogaea]|uniref:Uncharacterized protein n=1 Tax=Arachis hypogaea TaxID=3818 RepID=A0A445B0Y5_ARAHY|nr:hypothetical protein Ahy_A10g046914 [Arachis hypogaea]